MPFGHHTHKYQHARERWSMAATSPDIRIPAKVKGKVGEISGSKKSRGK
jgi:hypothetical protein